MTDIAVVAPAEWAALPAVAVRTRATFHETPSAGAEHKAVRAAPDTVDALYASGVRAVDLLDPVDPDRPVGVASLILIRELSAHGMAVRWRLEGAALGWPTLAHLYPPAAALDLAPGDVTAWREQFYVGMLMHRQGPGFLQVRDRRRRKLELYTIDEDDFLSAVGAMSTGCPPDAVPASVLDVLLAADLAAVTAGTAWWLPYRVRRWPRPPMVV
jgi:Family of unknown function (DUF5825)